jgi:hypothetical protein
MAFTLPSGIEQHVVRRKSFACYLLHASFLLGLYFYPEDGGDMFLLNKIFNGLHGVITQKIEFFITTAVRISNPTFVKVRMSVTYIFLRIYCI